MLPRTRALAIAFLLLTSAVACFSLAALDDKNVAVKARSSGFTASINVTVTDEAGRPIYGAYVWILGNATESGITPPSGNVLITGLDDTVTSYTLWANKTGYLNSLDTVVDVTAGAIVDAHLEITGGSMWGFVTSQLGYIPANVTINALGYVADVSTSNGSYTIEGIPSGNYTVEAKAIEPGYYPDTANVSIIAGRMVQQDFFLSSQNGSISGTVYDGQTHLPLNITNVSVTMGNSLSWKINQEDGFYSITNLTEGVYNVTATREGYFPVTLPDVFISRNGTSGIDFNLTERPRLIYGTVKSGTYLQPNVNVSVVGTNVFNVSDSGGDYRLENLSAGIYTISAQLEGYELAIIANVLLPVGGEVRVDIDLVALPGAIVRGEVFEKNTGLPLASVSVTIIDSEGKQRVKDTNFRGQFEFTGLADGNYTLQFEMSGYQPLEVGRIEVRSDLVSNDTYYMTPDRRGFTGFFFGFDLGHSMMILALFVTILMLAVAVYLRIRTFQAPENAPAVYDQAEEEQAEEEKKDELQSLETAPVKKAQKKTRKKKEGGS